MTLVNHRYFHQYVTLKSDPIARRYRRYFYVQEFFFASFIEIKNVKIFLILKIKEIIFCFIKRFLY